MSNQPPPFRATGRGFQNKVGKPATATNANGIFTNPVASEKNPDLKKRYCFITSFETGWSLSGDSAQSHYAKTFYPKNLHQNQVQITVACVSQNDYDNLVVFVNNHQRTILTSAVDSSTEAGYLDFKLLPSTVPHPNVPLKKGQQRRYLNRGVHYGLLVDRIEAGHERFNHFPVANLTCTVVNDYLTPNWVVSNDIYRNLVANYMKIFGNIYTPPAADTATGGANTNQSITAQDISIWDDFNHGGSNA